MKNLIDVDCLQKDKFDKMDLKSIVVRPIQADERETWDSLMSSHHYLGFRHLVGESIRYVALLNGEWVALLGWSSAAFKSRYRDEWIGWSEEQRWQRLKVTAQATVVWDFRTRQLLPRSTGNTPDFRTSTQFGTK